MSQLVLQAVAKPPQIIMACPKATILHLGCQGLGLLLGLPIMITMITLFILQPLLMWRTHKNPYFLEQRLAYYRCLQGKTYVP